MDPMSIAIGAIIALIAGPVAKTAIVAFFPQTAPLFASVDVGQKQLLKVINAANDAMNSNSELKAFAEQQKLRVAAKLIKD